MRLRARSSAPIVALRRNAALLRRCDFSFAIRLELVGAPAAAGTFRNLSKE